MDKLLTFAGYDSKSGPHIFPLETTSERNIKLATALHPDIQQYIRNARPIEGKTQLLIDALGCCEYWGSNSNGDMFETRALAHDGDDYGARTFEKYAYPFKHHVNKDPAKAYGDKVTLARFYAPTGRVQLIAAFHNDKSADIITDVENGDYPEVSMGCRVPNDRCSICGNLAKTRADYCIHAKYQMNKILPDGRRVGVYNDRPKFFDISIVLIGAEKASHVLKKVAHERPYEIISSAAAGENFYGKLAAAAKAAAQTKESDIDKEVPTNLPPEGQISNVGADMMDAMGDVKRTEQTMPARTLDSIAGFPLHDIFSTLGALGIPLKPHEFQRVILVKMGNRGVADEFWRDGIVFDESEGSPEPSDAFDFDPRRVNEKIAFLLQPHLAERSIFDEPLRRRIDMFEKRAEDWYQEKDRDKSKAAYLGSIPVMLGLAGAYKMFKDKLPKVELGKFERAAQGNPWLLPILFGIGVGASVGLKALLTPIQMHNQGPVDMLGSGKYAADKSAAHALRFGILPATYAYSGVQRHRAVRGEHLNWFDQAIARRPELAALAGFLAAPHVAKGVRAAGRLVKGASVFSDLGVYTLASGTKLVPAALAGAAVDIGILKGIEKIVNRRKQNDVPR